MHGTQLEPLHPECLVPIRGSSEGQLQGVAVLGPRLSEEPYSTRRQASAGFGRQPGRHRHAQHHAGGEDGRNHGSGAPHASRKCRSRARCRAGFLPQQAPSLTTLDCAGKCIQTRAVGGDYYDFLDLGSGRLGLVLADISGKGMSAALLMANLQANLRGQYALALEDIPRLLRSVNRLFYKNTETNHYATTFFAVYDDETRRLRYVNCGHNPPFLARADGSVERLDSHRDRAGTVRRVGLHASPNLNWQPGDVLVIYTDGISEASPNEEDEFGEERLIEADAQPPAASADEILEAILSRGAAVQPRRAGRRHDADRGAGTVGRC